VLAAFVAGLAVGFTAVLAGAAVTGFFTCACTPKLKISEKIREKKMRCWFMSF
jgi:hypothetical protein